MKQLKNTKTKARISITLSLGAVTVCIAIALDKAEMRIDNNCSHTHAHKEISCWATFCVVYRWVYYAISHRDYCDWL